MNTVTKRTLTVLLALLLLVYVGYQIFLMTYTSVEIQTVTAHTTYETLDVDGFAIRNEQVLTQATSGYVYYTLENGARVAKGGVIADIYPSEQDALTYKTITALDADISALQVLQKQGSVSKTNLENINAQIEQTQRGLVQDVAAGQLDTMDAWRSELMGLLNRKQILVGKVLDFEERLAALTSERSALEGTARPSSGTVTSPVAGYFISAPDGYEQMLSYDDATTLSVEQVKTAMTAKPAAVSKGSIGKVVGNYEWYLACVVPVDKLSQVSEGESLNVRLQFASDDAIPVTVVAINRSSDEAVVVLKCSYMSEELSSVRNEKVQILLKEHSGLYVPDRALQFNEENEPGVFVRIGTTLHFRRVQIDYHSDNGGYSICAESVERLRPAEPSRDEASDASEEDSEEPPPIESSDVSEEPTEVETDDYLQLYDDMVVGGKNLYDGKIVH
ncbi:MAG: hypothetical protein IKI63_02500 [Clostridia bacterium]|nr:hypothetical protein [Clostridia bacterium]